MPNFRLHQAGISLTEVALITLFMSLALVPIIGMVGGKTDAGPSGTSTAASRNSSREVIAANSIMERALAGEIMNGGSFASPLLINTLNDLPKAGVLNTARHAYDNNQNIWYEWTLRDVSYKLNQNGQPVDANGLTVSANSPNLVRIAPDGNRLVQATLRVYNGQSGTQPSVVFPTYLFRNEANFQGQEAKTTDIVLILDVSGSMNCSELTPSNDNCGNPGSSQTMPSYQNVSVPYLRDRYFTNSDAPLDLWNDQQLDLVLTAKDDETTTQFDERYLLGGGPLGIPANCDLNNGASQTEMRKYFVDNFFNGGGKNNTARQRVANLCQSKAAMSQTQLDATINGNLSRIEAARSAMLAFLLRMEGNQFLAQNVGLGFVTFSSNANKVFDFIEKPKLRQDPLQAKERLYFELMRERLVMINRAGNPSKLIRADGGTHLSDGLQKAKEVLATGNPDTKKIVILLSDGEPTIGITNKNQLKKWVTNNYADNDITLYTIGVIGADEDLMKTMATATPSGNYFFARNISELQPIFDQIAYEVEKLALLNITSRYHLNL
ncbi:MAG: vWA domain-containing protein [Candidatus Melainabacteria bacterium]|nr:vWA domain-containing protein [Candidatus Melainabacteria bacterium]